MSESPAPASVPVPVPAVAPIAPRDGSRVEPEVEAAPITEEEVGEYKEQDRYLPVSSSVDWKCFLL